MMARRAKRLLESTTAVITALVLVIVSLILSVAIQFEVWNHDKCLGHWADRSTARSERLTGSNANLTTARSVRDSQLSDLLVGAINGHKATKPQLKTYVAAVAAANKAEVAYKQALKANPVPPAPKYTC